MINAELVYSVAKDLLKKAMLEPTEDVKKALVETREQEEGRARGMYDMYFSVNEKMIAHEQMICPDTGNLTFFITLGSRCPIDPNLDWWGTIAQATEDLTKKDKFYKPLLIDLVTKENFSTNVGVNMPYLRFNVAQGAQCIEITASPKGGGAEPYTDYRVLMPADGIPGIRKFVMDCVVRGLSSGKTCPPNIVGIGIGGDAAIASDLAMQACILRTVGSRHPVSWVAELEEELKEDINVLGIGPMGCLGSVSAYDVHIEYAFGHMVVMPVAFNIQCFIAHRATAQIWADGRAEFRPAPELWWSEHRKSIDYYKSARAALAQEASKPVFKV